VKIEQIGGTLGNAKAIGLKALAQIKQLAAGLVNEARP
jgi:hypothetical protein